MNRLFVSHKLFPIVHYCFFFCANFVSDKSIEILFYASIIMFTRWHNARALRTTCGCLLGIKHEIAYEVVHKLPQSTLQVRASTNLGIQSWNLVFIQGQDIVWGLR